MGEQRARRARLSAPPCRLHCLVALTAAALLLSSLLQLCSPFAHRYEGLYTKRTGDRRDGLAMFWRTDSVRPGTSSMGGRGGPLRGDDHVGRRCRTALDHFGTSGLLPSSPVRPHCLPPLARPCSEAAHHLLL